MWKRLFVLCIFAQYFRPNGAACVLSKYEDGPSDWVKCSNSSVNEALNKGGPVVAAVTISHSRIGSVPGNAFFKYAHGLRMLNLQNCEIREIHVNAFADLTSLKKLSLSNNNITIVRPNWFAGLVDLEQLDLSFNSIGNIDSSVFARLTNLRRLNLDDNQLKCLEPKDMMPMRSLAKIRVIENPLNLSCRGKMTLWFNDKGINYSNGLPSESESWLDRVLWLCAEEDYSGLKTETRMRECVILNLFNQLRLALRTTNSYQTSTQQCGQEREFFTNCIAKSGKGSSLTNPINNGEAVANMLLSLRGVQEELHIS